MTAPGSPWLRRLFPAASPELLALLAQAAEQGDLPHTDFCTIRDLVELAGYEREEPLHVLLLVLFLALEEGSLCVPATASALRHRLADLGSTAAERWAEPALAALERYPDLIGRTVHDNKPVVLHHDGTARFLAFHKHLTHELALVAALQQRLQTPDVPLTAHLPALMEEVLHGQPLCQGGRPVALNRAQQQAVGLALLRGFAIVSGGPGTGKTSIVFTLLRCLLRGGIAPERLALAAPTGRAAQRLGDSIRAGLGHLPAAHAGPEAALLDISARTLHQLLGYQPSRGTFRHHVENPLPYDVVIVDEVSMVGLELMTRLLEAAAPATRLVFLGDKDQLPSVEAGALLAHLVPADGRARFSRRLVGRLAELLPQLPPPRVDDEHPLGDTLVVLEENYRSQPHIQEMAAAVNRQEAALPALLPRCQVGRGIDTFAGLAQRGGCWFEESADGSSAAWRRILTAWAEHAYLGDYLDQIESWRTAADESALPPLFAALERCRVLTLLREGPWGCVAVNCYLEELLRPRLEERSRGKLFAGAPVLITRNDHARQLYNGDVGITLPGGRGLRVVFPRQGGYRSFAAEALPAYELAFALTVHKSQGSEYGQVLLALPPAGGRRLLTKELLYTGITRAKHLAVLCGTAAALQAAVARRIERASAVLGALQGQGPPSAPASTGASAS